ncbi:hypothetical protein CH063_05745 [Colletotrichum higginsianum]|uniref:Uncharacterized protein n=1 Tax=Colletotrichum higginsianum (strain IMI 349063) TaxID=759273 RepID=H1V033_COLHI|nr:hypothetical protein CH063_05745 [Colletotrichum higginsianum]
MRWFASRYETCLSHMVRWPTSEQALALDADVAPQETVHCLATSVACSTTKHPRNRSLPPSCLPKYSPRLSNWASRSTDVYYKPLSKEP